MARFNSLTQSSEKIWNMDQLFTERIDRRIDQLDLATIEGNQILRYRILYNIFMGTYFKYEKEYDYIYNKFQEIKKIFNSGGYAGGRSEQQQQQSMIISAVEVKIDQLQFEVIKLLYISDLIGLKKKDKKHPNITFEWNDD